MQVSESNKGNYVDRKYFLFKDAASLQSFFMIREKNA